MYVTKARYVIKKNVNYDFTMADLTSGGRTDATVRYTLSEICVSPATIVSFIYNMYV